MHIVHVEDFIHPDAGYQVNLLSKLEVQQGHKVTVVCGKMEKMPGYLTGFFGKENIEERDRKFEAVTGVKIVRAPVITFYSGRAIYWPGIFSLIDAQKPDVLFVHGEDTLIGMQLIRRCGKLKYPMILDCHMLEMASMNRFRNQFRAFFRRFVTPYIIKHNIPLIRVVDTDFVQKCLGIPLERTILLSFGTDTQYFRPDAVKRTEFRKAHGIAEDDFVALYAGKLDVYKGGEFFGQALREKIVTKSGRKVVFVVVGTAQGEYGAAVERAFKESENRILRFPTQPYLDLPPFYQAADVAVFPKQCSMSFFEVQSCGLPVVLESNEINCQRVNSNNGFIFQPGDREDFRAKLIMCADAATGSWQTHREAARRFVLDNYDFVPIAQKFTDVMVEAVERFRRVKSSGAKSLPESEMSEATKPHKA